jgi:hypothetical protein
MNMVIAALAGALAPSHRSLTSDSLPAPRLFALVEGSL